MASDKYHWLARYYDLLFDFRRPFHAAHEKLLEPLLPDVKTACDLCCGTGDTALALASRGIRMYAVDISPEMCRITRRKSRDTAVPVDVLEADMRAFRLPQPVDLVTCEFDALNHVARKSDLSKVLKSVARVLRPGGHFFFDVNNRLAFKNTWKLTWFIDKDPVAMVMCSGSEPDRDRAWSDVEIFVRRGKCWRRHKERVEEVCWSASEMRAALRQAGFDRIRAHDAAPLFDDDLIRRGYRTFWVARRARRSQR